ncbi:MAG TPA: BON domain-containing protein [Pyrinomonadaceae bacterium]
MSYDEEQHKRSRVVVNTPTERREVVHQQTTRYPERSGFSGGMVAAVALTAIAATAIIFLFLMNRGDEASETNINVRTSTATQPTPLAQVPVIVQTPMTQPTPIVIQQAPPVIIQAPPTTTTTTTAPPTTTTTAPAPSSSGTDDTSLQLNVERAFRDDPDIAVTGIIATVLEGKATLTGEVKTPALKQKAERLVRSVKGIASVENKITVNPDAP